MPKKRALTTAQTAVLLLVLMAIAKVLGFVREMVLAGYFGAGSITDAFVMAQSIPNTFVAFVLSAASTAFMPIYSQKYEQEGEAQANLFASELLNFQLVFIAIVTVAGLLFTKPIVSFFAPGYSAETAELTCYYMRAALFVLFFTACLNVLGAVLEYKGTFVAQNLIGLLQNTCVIVFIIISAYTDYKLMIYGLVAGNALRLLFESLVAKKKGYKYTPSFRLSKPLKAAAVLALPVLVSGSFSEINWFIDRMLGSTLAEGSVSALNYGSMVVTTLASLTGGIGATLIYPKLNKAYARGDNAEVSKLSETGINLVSLICVPLTLGSMVYSTQIVQIIYERGAFAEAATSATSKAFFFYVIGLAFTCITTIISRVFFTLHDTLTPAIWGAAAVLINIGLNFALVKPMGLSGLALATSLSGFAGTVMQALAFRKKHPEVTLITSGKKLCLIFLFSAISVGGSYAGYVLFAKLGLGKIVTLLLAVVLAVAIYLGLMYVARFEELKIIKTLIKKDEQSEN